MGRSDQLFRRTAWMAGGKSGGRIAVFDKFLPDEAQARLPRRLANAVTRTLFTDINRRIGEILERSGAPLRIEHDEAAFLGGAFRILVLRKHWGKPTLSMLSPPDDGDPARG